MGERIHEIQLTQAQLEIVISGLDVLGKKVRDYNYEPALDHESALEHRREREALISSARNALTSGTRS